MEGTHVVIVNDQARRGLLTYGPFTYAEALAEASRHMQSERYEARPDLYIKPLHKTIGEWA